MIKGKVHSLESFGSVDGPGIRFLIFLKGCPMRCRFCHNPDTWAAHDGFEELSVEEILRRAERFRPYWGQEGGITVSGGEALLQLDFLTELFYQAQSRGITTCLDTSAQPFTRRQPWFGRFDRLMQLTDTVLLDIKHIDDDYHTWLTGHSNINILDCARYLSDTGKKVWLRHVLIPGITDDDESLHRLNRFLRTLTNLQRIDVLPYHTLGVYKWHQLGIEYSLEGIPSPTEADVKRASRILSEGVQLL